MPLDPTRAQRITASMAPLLMSGDAMTLQRLFLRAIGDSRYEPDNFEDSWPARFGLLVEPLALDWHQEKTGLPLIDRGRQVFHPARDYVSATLDARRAADNTVIDVKCINAYRDYDEVLSYYVPQLVVQQECAEAANAALLVVKGGTEPQEWAAYIEDGYRALVWQTIDRFWEHVESLTPPVPLYFPRVVAPEQWRRIDLDRDAEMPNWADEMRALLALWNVSEPAAREHETTKASIKKIFPDDCGRLVSGAYAITRAKNNAVTIRRR